MLTVGFEKDAATLEKLYADLGISERVSGANFVMREDGEPVGLMRAEIGDNVTITYFKIKNEQINPEDKEFFLRAMLFKFSLNPIPLAVKGEHPELLRFGFRFEDGYMRLDSSKADLRGDCEGKKS